MPDVRVFQDSKSLAAAAAEAFINLAEQSILDQGRFSVALSGGSTPNLLYQILANPDNQKRLDWDQIYLFFGDERNVPPDHVDSNFRMVKEVLLEKIDIPKKNIHCVQTELDIQQAAQSYEMSIRQFFAGDWPRFDLVLLGMGADGHTASLFPNSLGLEEENRWFIANFVPEPGLWRLTLTKCAINNAKNIILLVSGASKAAMVKEVLCGSEATSLKPIQMISPRDGQMTWMLDRDAAVYLNDDNCD